MAADCPARELHRPDENCEHHAAEGQNDKQRVERAFPAQDVGQEINLHGPLLLENLMRLPRIELIRLSGSENLHLARCLDRNAPFLAAQNVGLGLRRTTWKCITSLLC